MSSFDTVMASKLHFSMGRKHRFLCLSPLLGCKRGVKTICLSLNAFQHYWGQTVTKKQGYVQHRHSPACRLA